MNKKKFRFFITLLAVMLCMTAFSSVAYAGGGPETEEPVATPTPSETPVIEEGTPLDEDGNLITRDLLYDKNTNKQFIAVETRNGKIFYIVIDYDKPVDEDLEQYHAYFLNMVDERDLLDIVDEDDLTDETSSAATSEPSPEPSSDSADEEEPASQNNTGGIVAVLLIVAVIAAGVFFFFKFRNPKSVKGKSDLDDYDFGEDEDEDEPDTAADAAREAGTETEDEDQ